MLVEQIKKDSIQMRKERHPLAGALVTLISEATMHAKNDGNRDVTDADITRQIQKSATGLKDTINILSENGKDASKQEAELAMLELYMPKQLSAAELRKVISEVIDSEEEKSMKLMGKVMATLKTKHDGQYDGKVASAMVRELLNP